MKPMIRHCRNCKWSIRGFGYDWCDIKYKRIHHPCLASRLCRYFEKEGGA